jgi:phosphoenolpyruvate synthase/pyruvate phosphate dikinase
MRKILEKVFTREFPLIHAQMWGRRYTPVYLGEKLPQVPKYIFILKNGLLSAYRDTQDLFNIINNVLKNKIDKEPSFIDNLVAEKSNLLGKLFILKDKEKISKKEFVDYLDYLFDYWQLHYIAQFLALDEKRFSEEDREKAIQLRKTLDIDINTFWTSITKLMKKIYPELGSLVNYVSWDEVKNNTIPDIEELKNRENEGVVLFDGEIINYDKLKKLENKYNFILEDEKEVSNVEEIKGQIACGGVTKGKVKKVLRDEDLKTFIKGEILVSYMTMPSFLPAMEKASAFITDEGGITCHAAIFAREMKKPCIIGTKIATKVLKDGDLVEVNADKGIVKILKRK